MNHWMRTSLITASLLGAVLGTALAHSGPMDGAMHEPAFSQKMHERMAERHSQRLSALKTKLQLTASQEPAWKVFADAMQPAKDLGDRPDRAAMAKLSTPERIDQMQAWHARMESAMKQRGDAAKRFYAELSTEQKKVFDAETARHMAGHGHGMHAMH